SAHARSPGGRRPRRAAESPARESRSAASGDSDPCGHRELVSEGLRRFAWPATPRGLFTLVQTTIDFLGERARDALHRGQVVDARRHDATQPTETREQALAPPRAHAV